MKFSIILIMSLMILLFIQIVNAEETNTLFDNEHYLIVGHIYEPYSEDNVVMLTNVRTGEQLNKIAIECEHSFKVYLFNLANLHQGWINKDGIIITYHNNFTSIVIDDSMTGIQADLNTSEEYDPIPIITGTILIFISCGGYYYIKRKSKLKGDGINMNEEETEPITQETGFKLYRDFGVRAWIATLVILGYTISVIGCVYTNNMDALKELSIAILPVVTIIVMFYYQSSATRDMLEKFQK